MQITFDDEQERRRFIRRQCYLGVQIDKGAQLGAEGKNANVHMGAAYLGGDRALAMYPADLQEEIRTGIHEGGEDKNGP